VRRIRAQLRTALEALGDERSEARTDDVAAAEKPLEAEEPAEGGIRKVVG
jgi:hypothetical protein